MARARTTLVATTPPRPGEHAMYRRRDGPDESSEQATHFGNGQGKDGRSAGSMRGDSPPGAGPLGSTNPCQVGMRQQDQCDVTIPPDPTSHLILIQAQIFTVFKILLHMPSRSDRLDQVLQCGSFGSEDEVVGFFLWIVNAAADE